jgi:hypothetical protein
MVPFSSFLTTLVRTSIPKTRWLVRMASRVSKNRLYFCLRCRNQTSLQICCCALLKRLYRPTYELRFPLVVSSYKSIVRLVYKSSHKILLRRESIKRLKVYGMSAVHEKVRDIDMSSPLFGSKTSIPSSHGRLPEMLDTARDVGVRCCDSLRYHARFTELST